MDRQVHHKQQQLISKKSNQYNYIQELLHKRHEPGPTSWPLQSPRHRKKCISKRYQKTILPNGKKIPPRYRQTIRSQICANSRGLQCIERCPEKKRVRYGRLELWIQRKSQTKLGCQRLETNPRRPRAQRNPNFYHPVKISSITETTISMGPSKLGPGKNGRKNSIFSLTNLATSATSKLTTQNPMVKILLTQDPIITSKVILQGVCTTIFFETGRRQSILRRLNIKGNKNPERLTIVFLSNGKTRICTYIFLSQNFLEWIPRKFQKPREPVWAGHEGLPAGAFLAPDDAACYRRGWFHVVYVRFQKCLQTPARVHAVQR